MADLARIHLSCEDLHRAGRSSSVYDSCCPSCHDDEAGGWGDLSESEPGPNSHGRRSGAILRSCCAYSSAGLTRADYARMILARRRTHHD